ncbi:MAG: class I SAM-dependent methyltransferase [Methanomicrobiales archaeon]
MNKSQTGHHKGNSTEKLLDKEVILQELDISPGQTIMDVGCGNGYMTKEFSDLVDNTGKVYAIDRSQEAIEKLKKKTKGTNIFPINVDITKKTGIKDSSIDLVYLSTVLHIFSKEEKENFLNEVKRILKPKGKLAMVEIEKKETPFGPPQDMRVSPQEMQEIIKMTPLSLKRVGKFFYIQTFTN